MAMIINPGTHADDSATEANSLAVAERIIKDLGYGAFERVTGQDRDGWFRYTFRLDDKSVEVDIPGDDPDVVCRGQPWVSRRLYVDGSSWLYGFAMGFIARGLGVED